MADPDQVREAQRALGRKLAAFRASAGLGQHALATAVHYTRSTVANVEVGRQNAPSDFWARCDDVLNANGDLRAAYGSLQSLRAAAHRRKGASIAVAADFSPAVGNARPAVTYIPFLPSALDRIALEWLLDDDVEHALPMRRGARIVEAADVDSVAEQLRRLRGVDHTEGAGAVYGRADGLVSTELRRLLAGRPADDDVNVQLSKVAARCYELLGYQAVDLGADGLAQRHYLHALRLARSAGDRSFGAYLLAVNLGHLALHCGYPVPGLRMAQVAIKGAGAVVTPRVRAALYAVCARAHARLGDEAACTAALEAAEVDLGTGEPSAEPGWIGYFTAAYLTDEIAHCRFDLGQHQAAQREARRAVQDVDPKHVRRRAIDSALLASSLARDGEVDEACSTGREAVDLAAGTTSMRGVQRIVQLRVELAPFASEPAVMELNDYIRETLPAAA